MTKAEGKIRKDSEITLIVNCKTVCTVVARRVRDAFAAADIVRSVIENDKNDTSHKKGYRQI